MKKVNIGIAGLGRLGKEHAENLRYRIKSANLVAVCSIKQEEIDEAKRDLEIENGYTDFEAMLENPDLDAVCIVTSSNLHADQIIQALNKKKHVFCEKPLALNLEDCYRVREVAEKHPELKLAIGFNRRYDPSYYQAWQKIQNGDIGKPFMVYNQTVDMDHTAEFQIQFSKTGGGFLVDANIHDIDLIQWYLNSRIVEVTAVGGAYAYPGFAQYDDVDNVFVLAKLENGSSAVINGSRTAFHGHFTNGFIRGTKGEISVGRHPNENRLEIYDGHGVRYECVQTFFDRFRESFQLELESFTSSILNDQKVRVTLDEAITATKVAFACKESFIKGETIKIKHI